MARKFRTPEKIDDLQGCWSYLTAVFGKRLKMLKMSQIEIYAAVLVFPRNPRSWHY